MVSASSGRTSMALDVLTYTLPTTQPPSFCIKISATVSSTKSDSSLGLLSAEMAPNKRRWESPSATMTTQVGLPSMLQTLKAKMMTYITTTATGIFQKNRFRLDWQLQPCLGSNGELPL